MVTTYLDVMGLACLVLFAFAVWPPASLLVFGVGVLAASWQMAAPDTRGDS